MATFPREKPFQNKTNKLSSIYYFTEMTILDAMPGELLDFSFSKGFKSMINYFVWNHKYNYGFSN